MKFFLFSAFFILFASKILCQEQLVCFYFESNLDELKGNEQRKFAIFIDTINSLKYEITDVQSFCDKRGTDEHNSELAYKRLKSITDRLTAIGFNDFPSQSNGENLSSESIIPEDLRKWRKVEIHIEPKQINNASVINKEENFAVAEPIKSTFDELTFNELKGKDFEPVILKIEFIPGTNVLLDEYSYFEIERLFQFMKRNDNASAFIRGHVCCGRDLYLSMERAYVVYNSLIQRGISPRRLTFKGFDNTLPLVEETSEENMQKNRRVDVIFSFPAAEIDEAE